jgi:hypothetical protein
MGMTKEDAKKHAQANGERINHGIENSLPND